MRETPDLFANRFLPFAADEVEMVENLCLLLRLQPITPILRKDDVLQHLKACRIFHFAGHGQSNPVDPSRSCLLLEDWKTNPLTVGDLRDHKLQENAPFLGYLSACSTGANEAVELADEGIHLVSAFQLAGFRHVVGTLWEVSDKHCVDVARVLYETLQVEGMTDKAVCQGLHRAVRALRDGDIKGREARDVELVCEGPQAEGLTVPYWVPYVHFGV
jgi:CHAT domain-containing protein